MAQTRDYWYNVIINKVQGDDKLQGLNSTSAVADYKLWARIVADVIWVLDTLFDLHRSDVDTRLANLKPHTTRWYRDLALRFQYGQSLMPDTDQYANTGLDADEITAQKIITQAAVVEKNDGTLRMKVVKLVGENYAPLNEAEKLAFTSYIGDTKDAGVRVNVESFPPDALKLRLDIFYNPLVLNDAGARIDGTNETPVVSAINGYLKNLKFNGEFSKTKLADAIQAVDGVELVTVLSAQVTYGTQPYTEVDERYIPDAGYLSVADDGFNIDYRQYDF